MNTTYRNFQLRRTLPKLSGNMQLDLVVRLEGSKAYVVGAHLRPVSKLINHVPIVDERIMDRPHQMNIKKFYEATRAQFYEHIIDPRLASDWPMIISPAEMENLKYIKEFDDTYFAGAQRMSHKLYGCSHEILVPLWLDQVSGLKFYINFAMDTNVSGGFVKKFELDLSPVYLYGKDGGNYLLNPNETFHNDFIKYLLDYFDYAGISGGNNHVMSIDFKQNISTLRGIQVDTGNLVVRQNLNIARNLIFRERPLLEANSLLTNSFMDHKLIVGQMLNINICFDMQQVLDSVGSNDSAKPFKEAKYFKAWVTTEALRAKKDISQKYYKEPDWVNSPHTYAWQEMELRDFYTNHHYIPKIKVDPNISSKAIVSYSDKDNIRNALDYKKDYLCTDMIHQNKMGQSICHWLYAQQPDSDQLFNVYDGFGSYGTIKDKDGNDVDVEFGHGFGSTPDISDSVYNDTTDNAIWAGVPMEATGKTVMDYLQVPYDKVDFFRDASNFMNGIKFGYSPNSSLYSAGKSAPKAMYVGTMTTPWETQVTANWTKQSTTIESLGVIGIVVDRALDETSKNYLPKDQNEQGDVDKYYDIHMFSDSDNRWMAKKTVNGKDCRMWFDPTERYMKKNQYIWLPVDTKPTDEIDKKEIEKQNPGWSSLGISGDVTPSMLMRVGGTGSGLDTSTRKDVRTNILYVGYKRDYDMIKEDDTEDKDDGSIHIRLRYADDPLYVIFYQGRSKATNDTKDQLPRDLNPDYLTLGGVIKALRSYWTKYKAISDVLDVAREKEGSDANVFIPGKDVLPDMEDLGSIVDTFTSIEAPEIIFFNNSIIPHQDITLSPRAKEHTYYKATNANAYVLRYSGAIKPCLYPEKTERIGGELVYHGWYGRNFLWQKKPIFSIGQTFPPNLGTYIGRNIPPLYPSLDYDTVQLLKIVGAENESPRITEGDLRYNEVPSIYKGFTDEGLKKSELPYARYCDNEELLIDDDPKDKDDEDANIKTPLHIREQNGREYVRSGRINPRDFENHRIQPYDIGYWLYKDQYNTYEWPEYKWFNESRICALPAVFEMTVDAEHNDKSTLEDTVLTEMLNSLDNPRITKYDKAFLKSAYDFEYNLLHVEPQMSLSTKSTKSGWIVDRLEHTKEVLYKYKYQIKATLK